MDIRALTPDYAVSPMIDPEHMPAIAEAGYTTVICNRPDGEIPPSHHASVMKAAAEAAGLTFVENPVLGGAMTMENVTSQGAAVAEATGPVLAYCASGTRSSVVWSLSQAGQMSTDDIIAATTRGGYQLDHMRPQIDAMAAQKG
ncbi:TIGR01244 family sulfur transferase [Cognatishimia sp. MH4019]|uniref:TIGR01244 family sulfur transferase n=1 Tax=Cognatishimia sp. MH4019 TaxID=2854030 RepID=UPI001CD4C2C6|nr:TIGR01244 family sulfur transferase [Cognatishimia sp. MH4019]